MNALQRLGAPTLIMDAGCELCRLKFAGRSTHQFPCVCPCHHYARRAWLRPRWRDFLAWGVLFFLAIVATGLAVDNNRRIAEVPALRRGCVQVEFSYEGRDWHVRDADKDPMPLLRLHNVCTGTAVRLDEPAEAATR